MPTVPTYDSFQVDNNTQPLTPAQSPDFQNFAAEQSKQQGQAMQQFGGEVGKIALDMQNQANNALLTDATNASVELEQQLELGDNGYTKLNGRDALERPDNRALWDEYDDSLKKGNSDIASKLLKNDAQRQMFAELTAKRRVSFTGRIMRHVATQQKDYNISVQDGTIKVARNQMALSWGDLETVQDAVITTKAAVIEKGQLLGKSKEEILADMIDTLSPGNAAVISSAVDAGNIEYAQNYLNTHNAELTPATRMQMNELVKTGELLGQAQSKVDEIVASGVNNADKLASARKISDPKMRDAVVKRVKARISESQALEQQAKADHYDKAAQLADQGEDIPPSMRVGLSPAQLNALDNLYAKRVSGEPIHTDQVAYGEFSLMPVDDLAKFTPQQYHEKYRTLFDDQHYENGLRLIRAARSSVAGTGKGNANEHRSILSFDAAFKTVAAEAGVITAGGVKSLGASEFQAWARMRQEAARRINELETIQKKKVTSDEMLKISRQVLADKVYLDEWGADPQVPFSGVSTDQQNDAYVKVGEKEIKLSSVPIKDRAEITAAYRYNKGREPTQQEIVGEWVKRTGGK